MMVLPIRRQREALLTRPMLWAAALMLLASLLLLQLSEMLYRVAVYDGGASFTCYTFQQDPWKILEEQGVPASAHDRVRFSGFADNHGEIIVTRAFPVTLQVAGESREVMTLGGTVKELLAKEGLELGAYDRLNMPLGYRPTQGDTVSVTLRGYESRREEQLLPRERVVRKTPLLGQGEEKLVEEGSDGLQVRMYTRLLENGQLVRESLTADWVEAEPRPDVYLSGFGSRPVSPYDFEWGFDDGDEPVDYRQAIRGVKAAGYSAPAGAGTASGLPAQVGNVAVDPNVIPYGTRLYICSSDKEFIYGYAIAADTGTALKEQLIAVDLFYGSYGESAANGIRTVDIFLLD